MPPRRRPLFSSLQSPRMKVSLPSLLGVSRSGKSAPPAAPAGPIDVPPLSFETPLPALAEALTGIVLCPGGPPEKRYCRMLANSDQLVAAASSLLRSLKTARAALAVPAGLVELVSSCVGFVRAARAQMGPEDRLAEQLQQRLLSLVDRTPLLLDSKTLSEAALSAALQEAVELAVRVRQLKDRAGEGALLENAAAAVEAEMGLLGDCVGTGQGGAAAGPGVGVYEGLVAAVGESTRFLAQGKAASRDMKTLSFAPLAESGSDALRFARLFCGGGGRGESEARVLQGKAMHFGVHLGALLRGKIALLDCLGGPDEEAALAAEAALRNKMVEADQSVASLTGSITYHGSDAAQQAAAAAAAAPPEKEGGFTARAKAFTLRKDPAKMQDEAAAAAAAPNAAASAAAATLAAAVTQASADWFSSGLDARGVAGLAYCIGQLSGRLAECTSFPSAASALESSVVAAVEHQAGLASFPVDAVTAVVLQFVSRHGPVFSNGASRCARMLALASEAGDMEYRDLGLSFCVQSLSESRQQAVWLLVRSLLLPLLQLPGTVWTASSLAAVFERGVTGNEAERGVLHAFLDAEQRVAGAVARHADQFRMGGGVATCATLPFAAELMLRDEYRLLEPRILEVVLMTHTTHSQSSELLRLLLAMYTRNRTPSRDAFRKLLRNRVLDAIGYWFMSPLYLRPDHLSEDYVATWQAFLAGLIRSGIREAEKVTFKKFTQLLSAHYTRLETQVSDQLARQAMAAAESAGALPDLDSLRPRLVLEPGEVRALAEAITRVDAAQFAQVQPFELFSNAHMDVARAPGFGRMILQFNTVNSWVAHSVLHEESKSAERGVLLGFFVALAKALCDLNNFHGSYAVLCGLNCSPVARLGKSFRKLPKKARLALDDLMELNSHTRNYKVGRCSFLFFLTGFCIQMYREHLRNCKPPIIPQIGIISRDLFGLEENNADLVEQRYVNLEKSRVLEKVAFEVLALQSTPYVFASAPDEPLVSFFRNLPAALARQNVSEKALYDRSLLIEPREAAPEAKTKI